MTVAEQKRKNMKHLSEMNDYDFCMWMLYDAGKTGNYLDLSWKLDGFFLRFGKDEEGNPWFQTARSPVLYDPMAVIWHALSRGYDHQAMGRAEVYFHLIKQIWESKIMDEIEDDSCFACEVFDKSMAKHDKEKGTLTFVNIPYDDKFFTTDVTLFIYQLQVASTGQTWIDGYTGDLKLDENIRTLGSKFRVDLDYEYFRTAVQSFGSNLLVLKSLKHKDRDLKLALKEKVAILKQQFSAYVLSKAKEKHEMGENFEGVVFKVNNTEYKITTDYFKLLLLLKGLSSG